MRLIGTISNEQKGRLFSNYLTKEGIENLCEVSADTDWGSSSYGDRSCTIWVKDEDQVEAANVHFEEFQANPGDPKFLTKEQPLKALLEPQLDRLKQASLRLDKMKDFPKWSARSGSSWTIYIIALCTILFLWMEFQEEDITDPPQFLSYSVLVASPAKKAMLYDYPYAFELTDRLRLLYGLDKLKNPEVLPPEGQYLLQLQFKTKYWHGLYHLAMTKHKNPQSSMTYQGPLFEKIQKGEIWRLFSPCLMHGDLFHLFFNMIWLGMLGVQMESRLGKLRYLLFILVVGVLSNTAQYLMGGSWFLGFSGVICGMLGFIWARQRHFAWEGYQVQPATFLFILFFILSMAGLQALAFFLEYFNALQLSPGIANTAHIAGGILGYGLGRMRIFSLRQN